jgi:hypothetical protein
MNTSAASASPMGDADIHAFGPPPLPTPPRRRRWPRWLLGVALLGLVALLVLASLVWHGVQGGPGLAGVENWHFGIDEDGWHGPGGVEGVVALIFGVTVTVLVLGVVVPLVLVLVGLAVGLALALAAVSVVTVLGLAFGGLALVLAVASAPLWAPVLLIWWLLS